MEDFPTLHGPKNKTMGLEVISPSAQTGMNTDSQTEQERKSSLSLQRCCGCRVSRFLFNRSSKTKRGNQSQTNHSTPPRFHSSPQVLQAAQIPVFFVLWCFNCASRPNVVWNKAVWGLVHSNLPKSSPTQSPDCASLAAWFEDPQLLAKSHFSPS